MKEIKEDYDWANFTKQPISDLIRHLQEMQDNGYTHVEIEYQWGEVHLVAYKRVK